MAHGSSDDGLCWTNLAREFRTATTSSCSTPAATACPIRPTAADPVDVQVEDLAGLIKALKLDKPILMGHSMGSASVAWFAAKYPDVPRAVILEDPALVRPATPAAPHPRPRSPSTRSSGATVLKRNNTSEAELVADCMKNSPKWGQSECEIWAPSKRRHHPDTRQQRRSVPPIRELLPKITAPTLILKADAQGDLRAQNDEVAKLLPRGKIVHIDGAGHNVRRENKAQTIEVMKAFLSGT